MFNLKKAMAVAMTVALMVPSTAFAATTSPAKNALSGNYTISSQYTGQDEVLKITVNGKELVEGTDFVIVGEQPTALAAILYRSKVQVYMKAMLTITYTITKANKPYLN